MAEERRARQGSQALLQRELAHQMLAGASVACEVARGCNWKASGRDERDMQAAYAGFLQGLTEADAANFPEANVLMGHSAAAESAKKWRNVLESVPSVARARALFLDSPHQYAELFVQEFEANAAACRKHDPMCAEVEEARRIAKDKKLWNQLSHEELEAWKCFVAKPFNPLPLCGHLARNWARLKGILEQHYIGEHFFRVLGVRGIRSPAEMSRYVKRLAGDPDERASLAYDFHGS